MQELNPNNGIQSIDYTLEILSLFCHDQAKFTLKEIATRLNESPAKLHRYMVSLSRIGLLAKNPNNEYEVGNLALDLSFKALNLLDPVEEACKLAKELNRQSGCGVAVSIWGAIGPIVIKTYEPLKSLHTQIREGSIMSLINSSIGLTFSKNIAEHVLKKALDMEEIRHSGIKLTAQEKKDFLNEVKQKKSEVFTLMIDRPSPSLSSLSMPVFSISDEVTFVITAFHQTAYLLENEKNVQQQLQDCVNILSQNLGRLS